jgi:hypothetical protein
MAIILLGAIAQAKVALCQCGEAANLCKCIDPPRLSIKSNTIVVSGQIVHLSGKLPSEDEHWFYSVTCHTSSRLFNFSLWAILKFQDRDGYYLAKSWNLQILDSTVAPETEIIFDKENKFYFWGKVTHAPGGEKIRIDSIVGLPEGIHGEGLLSEVQQEIVPRSTTRH